MDYSRFLLPVLALGLLAFSTSARAQCRVCDEVIELNPAYATCFVSAFDGLLAEVAVSPSGRTKVDLANCQNGAGDKNRGGLLVMPSIAEGSEPRKSVYLLDHAYLLCLRDLVARFEGQFDPTRTFDLYEECQSG